MIDTEHVKCDTCTAPEPMELDASDEASRGWPTVDIETNPYKAQFPLFQQHPEIAFLDSAATAQRPACVLDAERDFYQRMNANPLRGLYSLSVEATEAIAKVRQQIADLIGAQNRTRNFTNMLRRWEDTFESRGKALVLLTVMTLVVGLIKVAVPFLIMYLANGFG